MGREKFHIQALKNYFLPAGQYSSPRLLEFLFKICLQQLEAGYCKGFVGWYRNASSSALDAVAPIRSSQASDEAWRGPNRQANGERRRKEEGPWDAEVRPTFPTPYEARSARSAAPTPRARPEPS